MNFDVQQINQLIQSRRSIKPEKFQQGKIVPEEIVHQILENGTWAPSHGLTEPWHFVVFSGEGIKKLAEFQAALFKQKGGDAINEAKYERMKKTPLFASHVIAICMKRNEGKIPEIEEIESVACAVQNMLLTAHAYGVVGFWGSGGITYYDDAKPFFGLKEKDKLLGYLYLGYAADPLPISKRKPLQNKVVWVRD